MPGMIISEEMLGSINGQGNGDWRVTLLRSYKFELDSGDVPF
jgi:hypothetical protein